MRLFVLFAFALLPVTAPAQEPVSIESIAAGFFGAETYCETGKWGMRHEPTQGFSARLFNQSYKASSALSTPQHSVFERHDDENLTNSERLRVRNADKAIVRYEGLRHGTVLHFAEITSQEANRPLTEPDLSHDVPFYHRFSLENSPVIFGVGLLMAASFGSAIFWWRVFSRAAGREDVVRKRRRLWQAHVWFGGVIAILLAALAALAAVTPGHGLLIVFALAIWCAAGFALTVCFTLMSYPVEWMLSRGARRGERQDS